MPDKKPYRCGGLVPFDAFVSNPPDLVISNEQMQEATELMKRVLKEYEQNKLRQLWGGEGYVGDQMPVLRDDVPRSDSD